MQLNSLVSFSISASLVANSCSATSSAACNSSSTQAVEAFGSEVPNELIGSTSDSDGREPTLSVFCLV
eukprot:CAMPEP_0115564270 /NCGR_PEP_ID=MMETSP0271-20121206/102467_1 /TAXON_ID=71861 /ORGANISM="Scrippsiella trochoidea, Strain CCMP3099" /LENGTH=67 /DNA_ID=CAMNT_0002998511 /DNA_START=369 /DNA_END=572 /DNA_ORIENTATION=-